MTKLKISALAAGIAQILIYGDIEERWWVDEQVNDAQDIINQLATITESKIHIRIKSNGGNLVEALAMRNLLAERAKTTEITFYLDGVVASAATVLPMIKGTKTIMASNALFVVHAPSTNYTTGRGTATDHEETAALLKKYAEAWAQNIIEKTGKPLDEIMALLTGNKDNNLSAQEALEFGFVDQVGDSTPISASSLPKGIKLPEAWLKSNQVTATYQPEKTTMPKPDLHQETQPTAKAHEKQRRDDINEIFAIVSPERITVHAMKERFLIDASITPDMVRQQILDAMGKDAAPVAGSYRVEMGADERDNFGMLVTASLSARAGLEKDNEKSRVLRGSSLLMMAEKSLNIQGVATSSMTKKQIVATAFTHSTSDFGNLLANVAEKSMLKGYEEAEETFKLWTAKGETGDFKPIRRVDLNSFPILDNVSEGAEYQYGTIGDRGEIIQLATYGKLFSITREAIINDDLTAFTKIPQRMGRAAIRTVGNLVYSVLTSNPAMSDGVALFHANHKNLLTSGALSTAAIDAMAVAMGLQTDGDSNATALNIPLAYIICPLALRGLANTVRTSQYRVGDADTKMANTAPNIVKETFEVIADARLDKVSSTNWYGAANPAQFDTIEVTYLDGIETPYIEQQQGFTTDGAVFKVRIDAGVKALDFRTLAKNPN